MLLTRTVCCRRRDGLLAYDTVASCKTMLNHFVPQPHETLCLFFCTFGLTHLLTSLHSLQRFCISFDRTARPPRGTHLLLLAFFLRPRFAWRGFLPSLPPSSFALLLTRTRPGRARGCPFLSVPWCTLWCGVPSPPAGVFLLSF